MDSNKYEQFLFEKELAKKLTNTSIDERRIAYKKIYEEYFERFPSVSFNPESNIRDKMRWQMSFLKPFLRKNERFLEIGAGNCLLSIEVARHVRQVIAYEVASTIPHIENKPENLILKIFDGIDFFEPNGSINIIYSNQVFEHLHIEDTFYHITQYYKMLKKRGYIIMVTPHAATGPHDISRNFSTKPEGFHMKEYTYKELSKILTKAGFNKIKGYIGHKKIGYISINISMIIAFEKIYGLLPIKIKYKFKENPILLNLFGIKIAARKP